MQKEWQNSPSINNLDELIIDKDQVSDEVIAEFVLRAFSRSFASMWEAIFSDERTKEGTVMQRNLKHPELALFCLSKMDLVDEWSKDIICLLQVRDTMACKSALNVSSVLIRELKRMQDAFTFLGNVLLTAIINVVKDGYQKSNHTQALQQIADIFIELSPYCSIPTDTFIQHGIQLTAIQHYQEHLKSCTTPKATLDLTLNLLQDLAGVIMIN